MIVGDVLEVKCSACGKVEQYSLHVRGGGPVRFACACTSTSISIDANGITMRMRISDDSEHVRQVEGPGLV